uniref:Col_cuticle_N domain-containing protein n=1 Tax=Heterorhabditis bacteriophora TaxID=37862 RepID=A0A1I7X290_HETBA
MYSKSYFRDSVVKSPASTMISSQVTVPIYSVYIVIAAMLSAIVLVAAMFYK